MAALVLAAPVCAAALLMLLQRIEEWLVSGDSATHRQDWHQ